MLARVNSIAYLCSTETRESSGKSACLLHSYKPMYNLSNFGEYYNISWWSNVKYVFLCLILFKPKNIQKK